MAEAKEIGRYVIKAVLGEGAMGSVYKGYDPSLERWVAIKTMRTANLPDAEGRQEFKERFLQESRANGRLNHPNVVSIYDCGVHENEPFLVMEFIQGLPLDTYVKQHIDDRFSFCIPILEQIASGLDYAHDEGVIHRDIKPGNILITKTKTGKLRVKIVDFGLARLTDSTLTQAGAFLGTPRYSSPEQIITGKVTSQSDVYSLGTVAYELLTARLPYRAESMHAIMYHIANEPPSMDFSSLPAMIDRNRLKKVFSTVFQKHPKDRYQSAGDFVDSLKPIFDTPKKPKPVEAPPKKPDALDLQIERALAPRKGQKKKKKSDPSTVDRSIDRLVEEARDKFQRAVKTKNLAGGRDSLRELERLNVNVDDEREKLAGLKAQAAPPARSPKQDAPHAQSASQSAKPTPQKAAQNTAAAPPKPDPKAEKISSIRLRFQKSAQNLDVPSCRELMKYLLHLKADISREKKTIAALEKQINADEAKRIKAGIILNTRDKFRQAIGQKDPELGAYYLKELKQLVGEVTLEEEALAQMIEEKKAEETETIKQKMITRLTSEFHRSLEDGNIENCRYYARELGQLDPELGKEFSQLIEITGRELHVRREIVHAFERRDVAAVQEQLEILEALGADVSQEKKRLREIDPDGSKSLDSATKPGLADMFKDEITQELRSKFQSAAKSGAIDDCKKILNQLQELDVDVTSESKALGLLE